MSAALKGYDTIDVEKDTGNTIKDGDSKTESSAGYQNVGIGKLAVAFLCGAAASLLVFYGSSPSLVETKSLVIPEASGFIPFEDSLDVPLLGTSSPVIRKWSDQTYSGFSELKNYMDSMGFLDYGGNSVGVFDGKAAFLDDTGRPQRKMENVMNYPKFRFFYNLLPAGTDPVTAFAQIMALRYREEFGFGGLSGTYLIRFSLWRRVYTDKNEAQLTQEVTFTYSASDKGDFTTIICL